MAQPEAQALAGYFPTPAHLLEAIAAPLVCSERTTAALDPCAGDGAALFGLLDAMCSQKQGDRLEQPHAYAIELEESRAAGLKERFRLWRQGRDDMLHGDALCAMCVTGEQHKGASLLFLNPPYDTDARYDRMEHRFLVSFTPVLAPQGVLVYLVPAYVLATSAVYLARHYEGMTCVRFPDGDYATSQQVVLYAVKRARPIPAHIPLDEDAAVQQLRAWGANPLDLSLVTTPPDARYSLPYSLGFSRFALGALDAVGLADALPPCKAQSAGQFHDLGLDKGLDELGVHTYPVAMPPRPGHIAQALAAGVLNGRRVTSPLPGLPPILAKGVFEREKQTVDTRTNKDGEIVGEVQVERPKLRLSVLDLKHARYLDIKPGAEPSGATTLETMNVADLVLSYQDDLIRVMKEMCPALHDPTTQPGWGPLPAAAREPFWAQRHAIIAGLKLIGQGKHPIVMGEVGSGKSTIALMTAWALSPDHLTTTRSWAGNLAPAVRNVLILCPPHLLKNWTDQARYVLPGARCVVIESLADLTPPHDYRPASNRPGSGMTIFILSRETAKLGHSLAPGAPHDRISATCPKCGGIIRASDALATSRIHCEHTTTTPEDDAARLAVKLAWALAPVGVSPLVRSLVPSRMVLAQAQKHGAARLAMGREERAALLNARLCPAGIPWEQTIAGQLAALLLPQIEGYTSSALNTLRKLLMSIVRPDRDAIVRRMADTLWNKSLTDRTAYGAGSQLRDHAKTLLDFIVDDTAWTEAHAAYAAEKLDRAHTYGYTPAPDAGTKRRSACPIKAGVLEWHTNGRSYTLGDTQGALDALADLTSMGQWHTSAPCGEPLYQATPAPRRYPLATYIARKRPDLFDLLILDEGHEYRTDGSAQERAAHRLSGLGKPVMLLSGSLANGYASGLFANMWALSRPFRNEFGRDDWTTFVTRYGYRKEYVPVDADERERRAGIVTDRVEKGGGQKRQLGEAPGILPVFVLRHLLPQAVTIHKADLDRDLPPVTETRAPIIMLPEQADGYAMLLAKLLKQIKADRFVSGMAGRLFGAMSELPSYLDRCTADTGNNPTHTYEVRYPASIGGELVHRAAQLPSSTLLPKERWLLDTIGQETAEGRNVLVFVWHTDSAIGLVARLQHLIAAQCGIPGIYLDAGKVQSGKREAWIDREVADKRRKVLLVNPVAVQTGLNNLVHFSTGLWYETVCDPIIWRQANGRLHRPGQTQEVRIIAPHYELTAQTTLLDLLARKVVASMQVDGLDIRGALEGSGAGDEGSTLDAMAVGQALYEVLLDATPRQIPPPHTHGVTRLAMAPVVRRAIVTEELPLEGLVQSSMF